jgi:hypothetical protein
MNTSLRKFTEHDVVELMRDGRRHLVLMHTRRGKKWLLVPGGELDHKVAHALLAREDIQSSHDGLFPGIAQTFTYRRAS